MLLPTPADVAALLRTFTTPEIEYGDDDAGGDTGEFTETTRPKASEVEGLIARYGRTVYMAIGSNESITDTGLQGASKDVIALGAAAEVARSFTQIAGESKSLHELLRAQFKDELAALEEAVSETQDAGAPEAGEGLQPSSVGEEWFPPMVTEW